MPGGNFDDAPPEGRIDLGVGQPSADLLPVGLIDAASRHFFEQVDPLDFNYGHKPGDPRFRASLAELLGREYGRAADPAGLFLTAGNSQALDFVCTLYTRPGDTVLVEAPSYYLAFQVFRDHGLQLVSLPMDGDGLRLEWLDAALDTVRPALLYTIPAFHNPGGVTLAQERRQHLLERAREHGLLIVADEVYPMLWFDQPPPLALGALGQEYGEDNPVLSLGTFSKILGPGMRLGWIQAAPGRVQRLVNSGLIRSGGSLNHFTSHLVRQAIDLGLLERHIAFLRGAYRQRRDAMDRALQRYLGGRARWHQPAGGYFFWIEFGREVDTTDLAQRAAAAGAGLLPGRLFAPDGGFEHCARLSFAHYAAAEIEEGIARIARALESR